MPQPSDYDRYHDILGVEPGASLVEIEESWRLRLADCHPDKAAGSAKASATARAQDINNARDELRGYWRAHGAPPPSLISDQARAKPIHLPDAEPWAGAAPDPLEASAASGQSRRPAPTEGEELQARRPDFRYPAAAALAFSALLGAFALLSPSTETGAGRKNTAALLEAFGQNRGDVPLSPSLPVVETEPPAAADDSPNRANALAALQLPAPSPAPELQPPDEKSVVVVDSEAHRPAVEARPVEPPLAPVTAEAPSPPSSEPQPRAGSRARPDATRARSAAANASGFAASTSGTVAPGEPVASRPASPYGEAPAYGRDPAVMAAMRACQNDLQTYCAQTQMGGGRIAQCLRENLRRLSQGCVSGLQALRAARQGGASPYAR